MSDSETFVPRPLESSDIEKVAAALAKAAGEFPDITKDKTAQVNSTKGNYSYNYADLATIMSAVRPMLAKNELCVTQRPIWSETGLHLTLETRLLHSSGQFLGCSYPLPTAERAQDMGSALTYARRYSLTALLGIATEEDDDGDAASNGTRTAETAPKRQSATQKTKDGIPPCPNCKTNAEAIVSKKGPGFYCFGCRKSWDPVREDAMSSPEAAEAAELFRSERMKD